ncbi:hypothetical protein [uncultured Actinomyces sp.]|uniref:hypothetical protein n=1 Tax=uncultured Actinomyces sp. TaxID=249061 RepID=UPI00260A5EBE|nr:hypothetical protein [uncultured Actinomyces sp.]
MTNAKSQATSKRRTAATRFVAALAVAATAGSALVGSQIVAPQAAYAAQEPATGINVGPVRAAMGQGRVNASATDETTALPNNYIRYGIVPGMSETAYSRPGVNGGRPITDDNPIGTYLGGTLAKDNDLWTYIARGWPWKWDENPAKRNASEKWMHAQYTKWNTGGSKKIWVNG